MEIVHKNKVELNEEQYQKLNKQEYKWFLTTAFKSQFITGLTMQQADYLFQIYNEIFTPKKRSTSCSQCRLDVCRQLGRLFFEYEAKMNEKEELKEETKQEVKEEKKKTPGRPKKQAKTAKGGKK